VRTALPSILACVCLLGFGLLAHGDRAAPAAASLTGQPAITGALPGVPAERAGRTLPGPFSLEVLRIVDGDTFEARVRIWLGTEIVTRVRIAGIDAPELHGQCAEEIRRAEAATEALARLLTAGRAEILDIRPDKYNGRVVARVRDLAGNDVGAALLAAGHAVPYRGGRRVSLCQTRH